MLSESALEKVCFCYKSLSAAIDIADVEDFDEVEQRRLAKFARRALSRVSNILNSAWHCMADCQFLTMDQVLLIQTKNKQKLSLTKIDEDLAAKLNTLVETGNVDWSTPYDSVLALQLFSLPTFFYRVAPMVEHVLEAMVMLEEVNVAISDSSADVMQMVMDDLCAIPYLKLAQLCTEIVNRLENQQAFNDSIVISVDDVMSDLPGAIFECPNIVM